MMPPTDASRLAAHLKPELRPLVLVTGDEDQAKRLYAVGARTREDAERMLPCLAWLERNVKRRPR